MQPAAPPVRAWLRLHRALMPDYNRAAALYWYVAVGLGAAVLCHALATVLAQPLAAFAPMLAGIAVAMVAGLFPIRIPRSKNSFAAGEIFIFLLLLVYGPAAAALAAAGEGLIGAWRTSRRWSSRLATPAMAALSSYVTGHLLWALKSAQDGRVLDNAGVLLIATMACALLYFVVNTALVAAIPYLKRREWPRLGDLYGNFGWIGPTFAGSGSVAGLLYLSFEQQGVAVLVGAVPVIAMLLTALHTLFRQQENDEALRQSRIEAAEREAALAARHMRELEVSERRFHNAFSHASIGMALLSFDGSLLQINPALCRIIGVEPDRALLGEPVVALVDPADRAALQAQLRQLGAPQAGSFELELKLLHGGGAEVWALLHGSVFADQDSERPCLILQVQDVTARRRAEVGLQQIAFHDSLTGLPNRHRFQEQLAQSLERARHDPRHHFALMFLDFDRFKVINDSLGHAVGDEFLVAVARRIQSQIRPHDVVARLGGDEFAIMAADMDQGRSAIVLADRVLAALRQPMALAGTEIAASASIGITFSSMGYESPADMLRDADTAMYQAKTAGKARYALFDSALHTQVAERMRIEAELRRALACGALSVAYQPLVDLRSGQIRGFEALARWEHAEMGPVSPASFIPVAEDAGMMPALTDFVLRSACHRVAGWQRMARRFSDLQLHVNLSGSDLAHPALAGRVASAIAESGLPASCLTLELTENILMMRIEPALPALNELRRLGVGLSIDDFGTGYSSLQHLSALPVDSLKIDRGFVAGLHRRPDDAAIVRAVLMLGESLGKQVIAEGIETQTQLDQLQEMGCHTGQGYLLSRPLTADQVDSLLANLLADPQRQREHALKGPASAALH